MSGHRDHEISSPLISFSKFTRKKVYHRRPRNIEKLKQFITEKFITIPQSMIRSATRSVVKRLEILYENSGRHIVTDRGMYCETHSVSK